VRRLISAWLVTVIAASVLSMWPLAGVAQVPRIGLLSPADTDWFVDGFREGLRELGYIEGRNIRFEYRPAHGRFDLLAGLAAELVALDVDVIVAGVTQASLAAKGATRTIPIVMVGVADPVGVGLVASLSRPGGNITGTSTVAAELIGKQLELLKEVDPNVARVAVLWNPANSIFQALQVREAEAAGRIAGLELLFIEATGPNGFEQAFVAMRREGTRALLVLGDPVFSLHHEALMELAARDRIAAVGGVRAFAEAGGLLSYGPSYFNASKRAAIYVDRILKGAKPGDLPVEQPTKFDLVLNLKAAKALNLSIPSSVLARADELIE
jgi:putative tryptophan/tyrosine transport system substrate-binding protein